MPLVSAPLRAEPPKLIIAILVDQLRYDYLERFHDQFTDGGFKLLTEKGAFMTFAHYNYAPTTTGPGHASVFSGTPPSVHGIIANDWFDKRTRKMVNCVSDPTVTGVGTFGTGGKVSPRNFIGSNFADQLRIRYRTKVVGISMKDRGAILPAGKKPSGAYWFEPHSGNFVTSSYYEAALPAWVTAFNGRKIPAGYLDQTWDRLLDAKEYEHEDNQPGEAGMLGEKTPTFPHKIVRMKPKPASEKPAPAAPVPTTAAPETPAEGAVTTIKPDVVDEPNEPYDSILATPFSNQLLTEFAEATIEGEHLGEGAGPDLLTISYSAIDACGHRCGPDSQEVQDLTLRLDRQLADLFRYVDKKVGLANVVIMLTADHGVMPTPEFATRQGLDGQRADAVALLGDLSAKLSERFSTANVLLARRIFDGNLYFNHEALRQAGIAPADVAAFIREWALSTGKYMACYSRDQLLEGRVFGPLAQRVANGYNGERSGDVVLVHRPFTIDWGAKTGTTHGSPFSYDTHVPVVFYGSLFKPGRYADDFAITDAVPTLCAALHITEPSGCIGKPLVRVLAEP